MTIEDKTIRQLFEELPGRVADELERRQFEHNKQQFDLILSDLKARPQTVITPTQARESRGVPYYPGFHYINAPKKHGFWGWLFRKDRD